jgi:hypothetical protein
MLEIIVSSGIYVNLANLAYVHLARWIIHVVESLGKIGLEKSHLPAHHRASKSIKAIEAEARSCQCCQRKALSVPHEIIFTRHSIFDHFVLKAQIESVIEAN